MYQIKTVIISAESVDTFDGVVNALIADGWTLGMRDLVYPPSQPVNAGKYLNPVLYAELYRDRPAAPDFPPDPDNVPEI